MCKTTDWTDQSVFMRTKCHPASQEDANQLFEQMINGYLLAFVHRDSYEEKVMVTISTICTLCKEFELDWISEGMATKSVDVQKQALRAFGEYVKLPVKTLFMLWRRAIAVGLKRPRFGLMQLIAKFQDKYNQPETAWWILASYLYTAFKATRMTKPDFSTPFEVHIDSRGRVSLRYYYRSKKSGREHFISSRTLCAFSNKVHSQQIAKLFAEPKNLA